MDIQKDLVIAVITGTTREQRKSVHAAKLVAEIGRKRPGVKIIEVDPKDFILPGDGNDPEGKDPRYTAISESADAFYIVTPEYNHSFPGSLKRLLNSELANYMHKPVAFAGVSVKTQGGALAIEALVSVTREMGMVATSYDVNFPQVDQLFDDQGTLANDQRERYERYIDRAYDELIWFARLLKNAR